MCLSLYQLFTTPQLSLHYMLTQSPATIIIIYFYTTGVIQLHITYKLIVNDIVVRVLHALPGMIQVSLVAQQQRSKVRRQFVFAQLVQKVLRFVKTRQVHHAVDDHECVGPSYVIVQTSGLQKKKKVIFYYNHIIIIDTSVIVTDTK